LLIFFFCVQKAILLPYPLIGQDERRIIIMMKKVLGVFLVLVVAAVFAGTAGAAEYIGAKKCKACHMKQYKSWSKTTMATSFENLKPGVKAEEKKKAGLDPEKDYTADADCLKCHTTGYGKPGGFTSLAETPKLINVQCEGCHGPGADFRKIMKKDKKFKLADVVAAGLIIPSEANNNCMECHGSDSPFNESVDPKYKFEIKQRLKDTHKHFPLKYEH
jgi:mono/diheme cytochrome c family protein